MRHFWALCLRVVVAFLSVRTRWVFSQSALTLLNVQKATFKKGISLGFFYLYQLFKKSNVCFLFSEFQLFHNVVCSFYQMSVVWPGKWNYVMLKVEKAQAIYSTRGNTDKKENVSVGSSNSAPPNCSIVTCRSPRTHSVLTEIRQLAFRVPAVSTGIERNHINLNWPQVEGRRVTWMRTVNDVTVRMIAFSFLSC